MLESNPSADAGNGVVSGRSRFHQPCPDAFSSTLFGKAINSAVNNGKSLGVIEKMHFGRGEVIEALVRPLVIVEMEIVE